MVRRLEKFQADDRRAAAALTALEAPEGELARAKAASDKAKSEEEKARTMEEAFRPEARAMREADLKAANLAKDAREAAKRRDEQKALLTKEELRAQISQPRRRSLRRRSPKKEGSGGEDRARSCFWKRAFRCGREIEPRWRSRRRRPTRRRRSRELKTPRRALRESGDARRGGEVAQADLTQKTARETEAKKAWEAASAGMGLEGALVRMRNAAERAADARHAVTVLETLASARNAYREASDREERTAPALGAGDRRDGEEALRRVGVDPGSKSPAKLTAEDARALEEEIAAVGAWSKTVDGLEAQWRAARDAQGEASQTAANRAEEKRLRAEQAATLAAGIGSQREARVDAAQAQREDAERALRTLGFDDGVAAGVFGLGRLKARLAAAQAAKAAWEADQKRMTGRRSGREGAGRKSSTSSAPRSRGSKPRLGGPEEARAQALAYRAERWGDTDPAKEEAKLTAALGPPRTRSTPPERRWRRTKRRQAALTAEREDLSRLDRRRNGCFRGGRSGSPKCWGEKNFADETEATCGVVGSRARRTRAQTIRRHQDESRSVRRKSTGTRRRNSNAGSRAVDDRREGRSGCEVEGRAGRARRSRARSGRPAGARRPTAKTANARRNSKKSSRASPSSGTSGAR